MSAPRPPRPRREPAHVVEARRDAALEALVATVPFAGVLGIHFDRLGDELTARLAFDEKLIGNPVLPALHGGATGAFLEITAQIGLAWTLVWARMEQGGDPAAAIGRGEFPPLPKTIDFTLDYLRSAGPRDAYARAEIRRAGRRYASVAVEAWQEERARPFLSAVGHFLMPSEA
ncbi:MAG: thioesterase [Rhodobacteraceae bacterium]|nr:thioesterase [Paracoccaceae bacterium]